MSCGAVVRGVVFGEGEEGVVPHHPLHSLLHAPLPKNHPILHIHTLREIPQALVLENKSQAGIHFLRQLRTFLVVPMAS